MGGSPIAGWFIRENPNLKWMMAGEPPTLETPISGWRIVRIGHIHLEKLCMLVHAGSLQWHCDASKSMMEMNISYEKLIPFSFTSLHVIIRFLPPKIQYHPLHQRLGKPIKKNGITLSILQCWQSHPK